MNFIVKLYGECVRSMDESRVKLQQEVDNLKLIQKDLQNGVSAKQKLENQLAENKLVMEELNILKDDCVIHKLIGPVLVKQDLKESKLTVEKRIEFINAELEKQNKNIQNHEKKFVALREKIQALQTTNIAPKNTPIQS